MLEQKLKRRVYHGRNAEFRINPINSPNTVSHHFRSTYVHHQPPFALNCIALDCVCNVPVPVLL
jgi:hypothetical protein